MIRVTLQLPHDPDAAIVKALQRTAKALAAGEHDEVLEGVAAPADAYSVTVHVLPDPATQAPVP